MKGFRQHGVRRLVTPGRRDVPHLYALIERGQHELVAPQSPGFDPPVRPSDAPQTFQEFSELLAGSRQHAENVSFRNIHPGCTDLGCPSNLLVRTGQAGQFGFGFGFDFVGGFDDYIFARNNHGCGSGWHNGSSCLWAPLLKPMHGAGSGLADGRSLLHQTTCGE
jgi:hypothetical protein